MKKINILVAAGLCVAVVLPSCKNSGKTPAEEEPQAVEAVQEVQAEPEANDLSRVPSHDNSAEDDKVIMEFIKEMFAQSVYTDEEFLKKHCTENMLAQLRADYDYEGEGYANWDFRSESNDGFGDNHIICIEKKEGRYYYEGNDGGTKFRNIISAFVKDGVVMFDGITRDKSYKGE